MEGKQRTPPPSVVVGSFAPAKSILPTDSKELESKPMTVIKIPRRIRSKTSGILVLSKIPCSR